MASSPEHVTHQLEKSEFFYNDPNLIYTDLFSWLDRVLLPNDAQFAAMVMKEHSFRVMSRSTTSSIATQSAPILSRLNKIHEKKGSKYKKRARKQESISTMKTQPPEKKHKVETSLLNHVPIWTSIVHEIKHQHALLTKCNMIMLGNARKIASLALREVRRTQIATLAISDPLGTQRRAMRDVLTFWRKNEREEKELRRRAERQAAEQRRAEEEARESRRQARKLDFLINQTELYAHFMARKLAPTVPADGIHLVETTNEFSSIEMPKPFVDNESKIKKSTNNITTSSRGFTKESAEAGSNMVAASVPAVTAPGMLHCNLKPYQLRGLSWLASLYDQGINGILADEMGLGKTVQSISLLAHLMERHGVQGPFLVVSPASTLHNWMDELARFVPSFIALPYWGPDRRALLRGHGSAFHVVVTSYQIVVSDERILNRIQWRYMILDEAQAIKSSSSVRWRTLLNVPARNRLLLTGTPIQNTMAELWALLHFIMPGLFDSHEEFASWFSKEIEQEPLKGGRSTVGTAAFGDAFQLRRLHAILRPFMLRRLKRDVEMELVEKIEIDLVVPPSALQRTLMTQLRATMATRGCRQLTLLKNAVMQARKLCNHPELLLPAAIQAPLLIQAPTTVVLPRLALCTSDLPMVSKPQIVHNSLSFLNDTFKVSRAESMNTSKLPVLEKPLLLSRVLRRGPAWVVAAMAPLPALSICGTAGGFMQSRPRHLGCNPNDHASDGPLCASFAGPMTSGIVYTSSNGGRSILNTVSIGVCPFGPRLPVVSERIEASGKMAALIVLLGRLKIENHRVLIYFQMTRMMDIAEEILASLSFPLVRLDGTCRIEDRRDLVHAFQTDPGIFLFLLSTRAGGLGINLTAADTVVFYDSDWNPTVDQQAMDVRPIQCIMSLYFCSFILSTFCFYLFLILSGHIDWDRQNR